MNDPLFMGIDVGTQGARVLVADANGNAVSKSDRPFDSLSIPGLPDGCSEQDPRDWWNAIRQCLSEIMGDLDRRGYSAENILSIAVDSTSGTVLLLDEKCEPLRPAVMYNDRRARIEADEINEASGSFTAKVGYKFNPSFALPRLLWFSRHEPELWAQTRHIAHAADYIVGRLTAVFDATDQTNALKTGFDLIDFIWPKFIEDQLNLDSTLLPSVTTSGGRIASVSAECARETGLSTKTCVVAGMTDACADQMSSGAKSVGDWNSVLGTTLVLKGITAELLHDPLGRVYCHRHPMGYWMPGGASNVGARILDERFPGIDREAFGNKALSLNPSDTIVYPLSVQGERFPFVSPSAEGFVEGEARGADLYAAYLQGIAFTERMAYDVVAGLGADLNGSLFSTGGGSRSASWTQIRSDVLKRPIVRAANAGAAMGSAIIAASRTYFQDAAEAAKAMVAPENITEPRPDTSTRYDAEYERFLDALRRRRYV